MYNRNGLRYFLNISTLNRDHEYLILPLDIRKYIWFDINYISTFAYK